jgi:hypothetical protein
MTLAPEDTGATKMRFTPPASAQSPMISRYIHPALHPAQPTPRGERPAFTAANRTERRAARHRRATRVGLASLALRAEPPSRCKRPGESCS